MNLKNLIVIGLVSVAFLPGLRGQAIWTQTSLTTNANWYAVACSADGSTMVAGDAGPSAPESAGGRYGIWYSRSSGSVWSQAVAPTNGDWQSFAVSADGTKMYVVDAGSDTNLDGSTTNYGIWASIDSGAHWNPILEQTNNETVFWFSIACSADGNKLAAVGNDSGTENLGGVYTSTNGGATWQHQTNAPPSPNWRWICSSADGRTLAAVFNDDPHLGIVVSTNAGATWTQAQAPTNNNWQAVACTPDGVNLYAAGNNLGLFWLSTNSGAAWFPEPNLVPDNGNFGVATSATGQRRVVVGILGIFASTNGGLDWIEETNEPLDNNQWQTVATSADGGTRLAANADYAVPGGSVVFMAHTVLHPQLNLASLNTNAAVSWIIPSTIFGLQTSGNLTNWVNVTNVPVLNLTNLENQVTVPESGTNGFYRMRLKPG